MPCVASHQSNSASDWRHLALFYGGYVVHLKSTRDARHITHLIVFFLCSSDMSLEIEMYEPERDYAPDSPEPRHPYLDKLRDALSADVLPCSTGAFGVKPEDLILYYGRESGNSRYVVHEYMVERV